MNGLLAVVGNHCFRAPQSSGLLRRLIHIPVTLAVCSAPAFAQTPVQSQVYAFWGAFMERCEPFLRDPSQALRHLKLSGALLTGGETADGRYAEYSTVSTETTSGGPFLDVSVSDGHRFVAVGCGISFMDDMGMLPAAIHAEAFVNWVNASPPAALVGGPTQEGMLEGQVYALAPSEITYNYIVEGVFSDPPAVVEVEFSTYGHWVGVHTLIPKGGS